MKKIKIILILFTMMILLTGCETGDHIHYYDEGVCKCGKIKNYQDWLDFDYHIFSSAKADAPEKWSFEDTTMWMAYEGKMYEIDFTDNKDFFIAAYNEKDVPFENVPDGEKCYFKDLNWYMYNNYNDIKEEINENNLLLIYYFKRGIITKELIGNKKIHKEITLRHQLDKNINYSKDNDLFNINQTYYFDFNYNDHYINEEFLNKKNINHRVIHYSGERLLTNKIIEKESKKYIILGYLRFDEGGLVYDKLIRNCETLYTYHKDDFLHFPEYDSVSYDNFGDFDYITKHYGIDVEIIIQFMRRVVNGEIY